MGNCCIKQIKENNNKEVEIVNKYNIIDYLHINYNLKTNIYHGIILKFGVTTHNNVFLSFHELETSYNPFNLKDIDTYEELNPIKNGEENIYILKKYEKTNIYLIYTFKHLIYNEIITIKFNRQKNRIFYTLYKNNTTKIKCFPSYIIEKFLDYNKDELKTFKNFSSIK